MSSHPIAAAMPQIRARLPGWWPPFAIVALAWQLLAVLGALASYGDAGHAASSPSLGLTLMRFELQYLPLSMFSLWLARRLHDGGPARARLPALCAAWLGSLVIVVPLLGLWQSAIDATLRGHAMDSPWAMLAQQSVLSWWFHGLLLTIAFGAHLAYAIWHDAHTHALAAQHTQQHNLALRLRLLQGQLEPFFLTSSLAGIDKLIRSERRAQATRALARLSDLLRYALRSSQSDWCSVADEVQFLRDFSDLLCVCHDQDFPLQWELGPGDWGDVACPPLLLFALIEPALGKGAQSVTVRVACGSEAQPLVHVKVACSLAGKPAQGGLRERLAVLYGEAAMLEVRRGGGQCLIHLAYPVARHAG